MPKTELSGGWRDGSGPFPDEIYLQPSQAPEVTWCEDTIEDDDIRYVRGDLEDSLRAQLAAAEGVLDEVGEQVKSVNAYHPITILVERIKPILSRRTKGEG